MTKLEELKKYVADLFAEATDEKIIKQSAIVGSKCDECIAEAKKNSDDYNSLLKDYKEVVIHSGFKSTEPTEKGSAVTADAFNADATFDKVLKDFEGK